MQSARCKLYTATPRCPAHPRSIKPPLKPTMSVDRHIPFYACMRMHKYLWRFSCTFIELTSCPLPDRICSPSRAAASDSRHLVPGLHHSCRMLLQYLNIFGCFLFSFVLFFCEYLWVFKEEFAACLPTVCNPEKFYAICPCHSSFVVVVFGWIVLLPVLGGC